MFGRLFQKKKPRTYINELAGFFVELVSRSKNYRRRPVYIHFIVEGVSGKPYRVSDIGDFLPFLRGVLFEAAQNTVPNPETSLSIHKSDPKSRQKILAGITGEVSGNSGDFFIITWAKPDIQNDIAKAFSGLSESGRTRITLFHLPLRTENSSAQNTAFVSAIRSLLRGEDIEAERTGPRILQGKI
jgi:hypothetical protein